MDFHFDPPAEQRAALAAHLGTSLEHLRSFHSVNVGSAPGTGELIAVLEGLAAAVSQGGPVRMGVRLSKPQREQLRDILSRSIDRAGLDGRLEQQRAAKGLLQAWDKAIGWKARPVPAEHTLNRGWLP
jgi:hypothetical protein